MKTVARKGCDRVKGGSSRNGGYWRRRKNITIVERMDEKTNEQGKIRLWNAEMSKKELQIISSQPPSSPGVSIISENLFLKKVDFGILRIFPNSPCHDLATQPQLFCAQIKNTNDSGMKKSKSCGWLVSYPARWPSSFILGLLTHICLQWMLKKYELPLF